MQSHKYNVGAEGPKSARVAIVAEKGAWDEVSKNRPLVGATGSMARDHCRLAGVDAGKRVWQDRMIAGRKVFEWSQSSEVYLTNSVHNFDNPDWNPTLADICREQYRLFSELAELPNLNVIIALGNWSLMSLGNLHYNKYDKKKQRWSGIGNWRGSVIPSMAERADGTKIKMVPSYHPSFYVNDQWQWKPIVQFDFNKAIEQSAFPEINHTERWYNIRPANIDEAMFWFDKLERDLDSGLYDYKLVDGRTVRCLAHDIECLKGYYKSRYVTCFSLAITPMEAFCFPVTYNDRTPYFVNIKHEAMIFQRLAKIMNREDIIIVGQNISIFDLPIIRKHGVTINANTLRRVFDTQRAHNYLAADLKHSLEFLVSLYTDEEYYKDESGDWTGNRIKVPEDQFWIYSCKDSALVLPCGYGIMNDLIEAGVGH